MSAARAVLIFVMNSNSLSRVDSVGVLESQFEGIIPGKNEYAERHTKGKCTHALFLFPIENLPRLFDKGVAGRGRLHFGPGSRPSMELDE